VYDWLCLLESCESTNTWALEQLSQLKHGDVVFTREQTAGRGQFDRVWHSQPGILTASFVLDLPVTQLSGFSLIAGLAVIQAIESLLPIKLQLKWTNDVFAAGQKLAGILCESRLQADQARLVVGVGLNRISVPEFVTQAISLSQLSATVPDEEELLTHLRDSLLRFSQYSLAELLPELRAKDFLYRQIIEFQTSSEILIGEAAGIDEEGRLLMRLPNGIEAFRSGRVLRIHKSEWENQRK
jgi:BirA family biotin operon repressor/biotin-[acetyl-CoA-carboxylase] ligase